MPCPSEGSSDEPLLETEPCSPEEKFWHGETELATVLNNAGEWEIGSYVLSYMFDDNANTLWHSAKLQQNTIKSIIIDFQVRIFQSSSIFLNATNYLLFYCCFESDSQISPRGCNDLIGFRSLSFSTSLLYEGA